VHLRLMLRKWNAFQLKNRFFLLLVTYSLLNVVIWFNNLLHFLDYYYALFFSLILMLSFSKLNNEERGKLESVAIYLLNS
jgi:hypothetical protein